MWIIYTVSFIVALIISAAARAYVIMKIWDWYVVSAFTLPQITMATAFGLSLLASLFFQPQYAKSATQGKDKAEVIGEVVGMFLGQLIGYLAVLCMGALIAP